MLNKTAAKNLELIPVLGKGHFRLFAQRLAPRLCLRGSEFLGLQLPSRGITEMEKGKVRREEREVIFFSFSKASTGNPTTKDAS